MKRVMDRVLHELEWFKRLPIIACWTVKDFSLSLLIKRDLLQPLFSAEQPSSVSGFFDRLTRLVPKHLICTKPSD